MVTEVFKLLLSLINISIPRNYSLNQKDKGGQQILTFKNLEAADVLYFCL